MDETKENETVKTEEEPEKTAPDGEHEEEKEKESDDPMRDALAKLQDELKEAKDTYLRMLAEYDNFRRRTAKEKQSVWSDAVAETLKGILPIADNLERAASVADADAEKVQAGLQMTLTALTEFLTKQGITAFGEAGETFDPNLHNAVMHIEDETLGEGVIAEVFQRGYRLGDKVIRFAMVKVAN